MSLGVALKRAFGNSSELPVCSIRVLLLADVLANLLQFKPDRRNRIAPGPEMLAREIPLFTAQPGNGNRTLPFEKPDHRSHWMLGRNGDAHVHMVWHQMSLQNLTFFLPCQRMKDLPQMTARLPEDGFPPPFRHEHNMVLAVPFGMG